MPLAGFHDLRIAEVRRETVDAVSLLLDVPAEQRDRFAYRPGQYLTLRTEMDGRGRPPLLFHMLGPR